jgi:hypothetical protein
MGVVDPSTAMRAMSLQYRDPSGAWIEVLQARWTDQQLSQWHGFLVPAPHDTVAASEWRVVALEGGNREVTNIGWIEPRAASGDAFDLVRTIKYEVVLIATVLAAGIPLALAFFRGSRLLFLFTCLVVVAASNAVFFGVAKSMLIWFPDSGSYWQWPPHPLRPAAFSLLLRFVVHHLGFEGLNLLQFNMLLGSYLFALGLLAHLTRSFLLLTPFALLPLFWGNFAIHAANVLTEPWFMTGLILTFAGAVGLIARASYPMAIMTGASLALVVAGKSVGVVLIVPLLLAFRFIPGPLRKRAALLGITMVPSIALYLAMSIYGAQLNGRFSPQTAAGIALSGQVGWMLDPRLLDEKYRSAGEAVAAEIAKVYAKVPPMTNPREHVRFTTYRYNQLLHEIIGPTMAQRLLELDGFKGLTPRQVMNSYGDLGRSFYVRLNDLLLAWSVASIKADPLRYLAFCTLHYWGLWQDSLQYYYSVGRAAAQMLLRAEGLELEILGPRPWNVADFEAYYDRHIAAAHTGALAVLQLKHVELPVDPIRRDVATFLMIASLILCALYLLPMRYSVSVAGLIVAALLINAYLTAQALFQVTLERYGEVIVPVIALCVALACIAVRDALAARLQVLRQRLDHVRSSIGSSLARSGQHGRANAIGMRDFVSALQPHRERVLRPGAGLLIGALVVSSFVSYSWLPWHEAFGRRVTLEIVATGERNPESKSAEVWIQSLQGKPAAAILGEAAQDNRGWEVRDPVLVSYQFQPARLVVDMFIAGGSKIAFGKHPYSGKVRLVIDGRTSEYDLYSPMGSGLEVALDALVDNSGSVNWNSMLQMLLLSLIVFGAVAGLLYGLLYGLRSGLRLIARRAMRTA